MDPSAPHPNRERDWNWKGRIWMGSMKPSLHLRSTCITKINPKKSKEYPQQHGLTLGERSNENRLQAQDS